MIVKRKLYTVSINKGIVNNVQQMKGEVNRFKADLENAKRSLSPKSTQEPVDNNQFKVDNMSMF